MHASMRRVIRGHREYDGKRRKGKSMKTGLLIESRLRTSSGARFRGEASDEAQIFVRRRDFRRQNHLPAAELLGMIRTKQAILSRSAEWSITPIAPKAAAPKAAIFAVSVNRLIASDYLICLDDSGKF
jgi:hypothetical protein